MKSVSFCTDLTHRRWSLLFRSEVWQGKETGNPGENESLSLAPSSLCYFLCPGVEGRALTLGTREQREFRGLVMATWSICKTYACVHFTTGKKVRGKREILHSGRSRRKASWSRRFRSLGGRGLLSCLCSKEMINLPGWRFVCPFPPQFQKV